jgi:hypothetical protein
MQVTPLQLTRDFDFTCYNGLAPLPLGELIDEVHTPGKLQTIKNIETLSPDLQELIYTLKEKSLNSTKPGFQEVLTLACLNNTGGLEYTSTTSHSYNHVNGTDLYRLLTTHPVLDQIDEGLIPDELIHIHSHPSAEFRPPDKQHNHVLVSTQDVAAYQNIASFLSHYAGEDIPMRGIVAPVGAHCGDVISEMMIEPPSTNERNPQWIRRAEELRSFRQAQRNFIFNR